MNLWCFSLQTWQVWSLSSPFAGKCSPTFSSRNGVSFLFLPLLAFSVLQLPTNSWIRSSLKVVMFRSMLFESDPLHCRNYRQQFLGTWNEVHVPAKLLSAFTNCSHLIISVHSSHVCIVVNYYFVWLDINLSILPSASLLLLMVNSCNFIGVVRSR